MHAIRWGEAKVDTWKQLPHVMMRTTFLKAVSKLYYVQAKLIQTKLFMCRSNET
jgi:hypothetical protein